jgi:hypothetical protein
MYVYDGEVVSTWVKAPDEGKWARYNSGHAPCNALLTDRIETVTNEEMVQIALKERFAKNG